MVITLRHVLTVPGFSRRPGFCRSGARAWFDAHGIDWADFKRRGVDESVALSTGDPFAAAVVDWAHKCEERINGR